MDHLEVNPLIVHHLLDLDRHLEHLLQYVQPEHAPQHVVDLQNVDGECPSNKNVCVQELQEKKHRQLHLTQVLV